LEPDARKMKAPPTGRSASDGHADLGAFPYLTWLTKLFTPSVAPTARAVGAGLTDYDIPSHSLDFGLANSAYPRDDRQCVYSHRVGTSRADRPLLSEAQGREGRGSAS
jgi:hypothetical protein